MAWLMPDDPGTPARRRPYSRPAARARCSSQGRRARTHGKDRRQARSSARSRRRLVEIEEGLLEIGLLHEQAHDGMAGQHLEERLDRPGENSEEPVVLDVRVCLLYTSDAADDLTRVDLGGRR